jgi:hypothetical protein
VALFELFREAAPRRFFAGAETGEAGSILAESLPAACRDIVAAAGTICARRFDLLGYRGLWFGEAIDWHLDPVAGVRAPARHWSRIDPLDRRVVGDSKVIWELNRHQWLIPLAQAFWLTGDRRYAKEAADLVDDWCRANPYGRGMNWSSSLEVAYRVIAWIWTFVLLRDAEVLTPREFSGLLSLVRLHALHIERYLSRYFSPNTHITGEALGLLYVGVMFPEFTESGRWRSLGRQILIDQCDQQIRADGVHFEQATCYQRYTLEIYIHFLVLAGRNDMGVPSDLVRRVERLAEFLIAVMAPDGTMPEVGDGDGGWVVPLARREPNDCRGLLATAAAVFGRGDFAWAARGAAPEVLWILGANGWRHLARLGQHPPGAPASQVFPEGGYAVMRSGWTADAHQLVFDVGPLGCPLSGAHGHADLLSVHCAVFGEPCLVDAGTFCYTSDSTWRDYFRETAAHNTVVVDGVPQADSRPPFEWATRPSAKLLTWESNDSCDFADASHDAYSRLDDPVLHRRRVLFVKPRYWVIVDDLSGRLEHEVEIRFQFAPRVVQIHRERWAVMCSRRGASVWLAPFARVALVARVAEGGLDPIEGWVSTHYGRRQPAPAVVFATRAQLPLRVATVLIPVGTSQMVPPAVEARFDESGQLSALQLQDDREIVLIDDGPLRVTRMAGHTAAEVEIHAR